MFNSANDLLKAAWAEMFAAAMLIINGQQEAWPWLVGVGLHVWSSEANVKFNLIFQLNSTLGLHSMNYEPKKNGISRAKNPSSDRSETPNPLVLFF